MLALRERDVDEERDADPVQRGEERGQVCQRGVVRRVNARLPDQRQDGHLEESLRRRPRARLWLELARGLIEERAHDLTRAVACKENLLDVDELQWWVALVKVWAESLVEQLGILGDAPEDLEGALDAGHVVDRQEGHKRVEDRVLQRLQLRAWDGLGQDGEHLEEGLPPAVPELLRDLRRHVIVFFGVVCDEGRLQKPPHLALDEHGEARLAHDPVGKLQRARDAGEHGHDEEGGEHHDDPLLEVRDAAHGTLGVDGVHIDREELEHCEQREHLLRPLDGEVRKDGADLQEVDRDRDRRPVEANLGQDDQQPSDDDERDDAENDHLGTEPALARRALAPLEEVQASSGQARVAPNTGRTICVRPILLLTLKGFAKASEPLVEGIGLGRVQHRGLGIRQREVIQPPRLVKLLAVVVDLLVGDEHVARGDHREHLTEGWVNEGPPACFPPLALAPFQLVEAFCA